MRTTMAAPAATSRPRPSTRHRRRLAAHDMTVTLTWLAPCDGIAGIVIGLPFGADQYEVRPLGADRGRDMLRTAIERSQLWDLRRDSATTEGSVLAQSPALSTSRLAPHRTGRSVPRSAPAGRSRTGRPKGQPMTIPAIRRQERARWVTVISVGGESTSMSSWTGRGRLVAAGAAIVVRMDDPGQERQRENQMHHGTLRHPICESPGDF